MNNMANIIEITTHLSWPELVVSLLESEDEDSKIYRGQSNSYSINQNKSQRQLDSNNGIDFKNWPLISSFDRFYLGFSYHFSTFLNQQLEDNLFGARYGKHRFKEIFYLKDCNQLERIYYLQHYSIPTCFLDCSLSSLTALFFCNFHSKISNYI
jgi:hypothetical protein